MSDVNAVEIPNRHHGTNQRLDDLVASSDGAQC
jgi:hypothetical protein